MRRPPGAPSCGSWVRRAPPMRRLPWIDGSSREVMTPPANRFM